MTSVLVGDDSGLIQSLYAVIGEPPFPKTYSKIRTKSDAVTRSSRGLGGRAGTPATRSEDTGENSDHPSEFSTLYLSL